MLPNERFTLSLYGDISKENIQVSEIEGQINLKDYVMDYIHNHKKEFQETATDKKLYRYFGDFFGFVCIYY